MSEVFLAFPKKVFSFLGDFKNIFPAIAYKSDSNFTKTPQKPKSVNYHFLRTCNYECGFCFHTAKTSFILQEEKAKEGLKMLKEAGMEKINFAGGEPFLKPTLLGNLVRYCKEELQLAVSIVTNGSKVKENWFEKYAEYVDIIAVSCDSFNEETNIKIGRGKGNHVQQVKKVAELCKQFGVKFKINTVCNKYNVDEDMTNQIADLSPCRWKVFQVLVLEGENKGDAAIRDASRFKISDSEFASFIDKHSSLQCLVPESNDSMKNSYLILDEYMRFLNCSNNGKEPTSSIFDVGVEKALSESGFDSQMFVQRGGVYDWNKGSSCSSSSQMKDIEDL